MLEHVLSILYPNLCIACRNYLLEQENYLCLYCTQKINWVPYSTTNLPYLEERFYGKFSYQHVQSLMFYDHDGISKELLHHLKYKNKPEIGAWLTEYIFLKFGNHPIFNEVDAIVKIPIHKKKLKIRGYNQLDVLADELSKRFNIPVIENSLVRSEYTRSQTFKNITERSYRKEIFQITDSKTLEGKHLLIIDDVITTGSTIEQMARLLQKIQDVKISVFALATAK